MNKIRKQRLCYIILFAASITLATSLILYALKQNINVFVTPSQLTSSTIHADYQLRLGGVVKKNSIAHSQNNLAVQFTVTDFKSEIIVSYVGILPDLFQEGKGVIAEGKINSQGVFMASQVLAKHDENYMPKKVYEALRKGE